MPEVAGGYLAPYDSWGNRAAVYAFVCDIPSPYPRGRLSTNESTSRRNASTLLAEIERKLPMFANRPTCLIWGMQDWCFRPDCLERFIEAWPAADVHRLADVGHWVVEDAPQEALAIVDRFLTTTSIEVTRK